MITIHTVAGRIASGESAKAALEEEGGKEERK
jgi:hypothetical protein